jgi:hypothetical protein
MKRAFAAIFGLTLAAGSAAFAQRADRNVEQPIVRSSLVQLCGGDDIRAACSHDGRNRSTYLQCDLRRTGPNTKSSAARRNGRHDRRRPGRSKQTNLWSAMRPT